ncbi:MAG TPA: thrombospondin type 3 repeat-containing protein [Solirubrobacteraceae bacterium]|nr:thrombospondin type 3 repeat-containing protein [Solirubrobacteraceae bacterium]
MIALAMAAGMLAAASPAMAQDALDSETLNSRDANGNEIPLTPASTVVLERTFDSANFTTTELNPDRTGCSLGGGQFTFGGRTGWVRFLPGVAGRVKIEVTTTTYDAIGHAWDAPNIPFNQHATAPGDLVDKYNCADQVHAPGTEIVLNGLQPQARITPGRPVHVQTLSFCGTGPDRPTACPNPDVTPGGPTTVRVTFTPDNADGDGVADTLDACPNVPGSEADGCPPPDRDADGIIDAADACPDVAGVAPDGCPPDTDGDGIANAVDACPFQVGVAPTGCPADPDADRDGIPIPVDQCPAQAGKAADGCADSDGDGRSDRVDKCPTVKGDGADGCPTAIGAKIAGRWLLNSRQTKMVSLTVEAPVGARIALTCTGRKPSCAFKKKTIASTKKASTSLTKLFGAKRIFAAGSTITVRVTVPGRIGTYQSLRMRTGRRLPQVTKRCVDLAGKVATCA